MTLLRATTSETSGGTPCDLLETRCRALQVLSGRFTEDFGCKFGANVDFGADFPHGCANVWCECLVRFFVEGAKPQNRALGWEP